MTPHDDRFEKALDEIADWHVKISSGDSTPETLADFKIWLAEDPVHETVYQQMQQAFSAYDTACLNADMPATLLDRNPPAIASLPAAKPVFRHRTRWAALGTLAACLILMIGVYYTDLLPRYAVEQTAIGQQRTVILADGSRLSLNTDTRLSYRLTERQRHIRLDRGEAYFEVAKNKQAPFVVTVNGRDVRAVGTAFNIRNLDGKTMVFVAEGIVDVSAEKDAIFSDSLRLAKGMAVSYTPKTTLEKQANITPWHALSWRNRQLFYHEESLSAVIADLNRYFPKKITTTGQAIKSYKVSLVVNLSDRETVLKQISQQFPLTITESGPRTIIAIRKE